MVTEYPGDFDGTFTVVQGGIPCQVLRALSTVK